MALVIHNLLPNGLNLNYTTNLYNKLQFMFPSQVSQKGIAITTAIGNTISKLTMIFHIGHQNTTINSMYDFLKSKH